MFSNSARECNSRAAMGLLRPFYINIDARLAVKEEKKSKVFYLKNYTPLNPLSRGEQR